MSESADPEIIVEEVEFLPIDSLTALRAVASGGHRGIDAREMLDYLLRPRDHQNLALAFSALRAEMVSGRVVLRGGRYVSRMMA